MTPEQIQLHIIEFDVQHDALVLEEQRLSFAAINGDAEAESKIQGIREQLAPIANKRLTLQNAIAEAERVRNSGRIDIRKQHRINNIRQAKEILERMRAVAKKIDHHWGHLGMLVDEMAGLEQSMRKPQAALGVNIGRMGQGDLADFAVMNLANLRNPRYQGRRIHDMFENAWDEVLTMDEDD